MDSKASPFITRAYLLNTDSGELLSKSKDNSDLVRSFIIFTEDLFYLFRY